MTLQAQTPQPVILLTGQPGIGKSTIIQRLIEISPEQCAGFFTREMRDEGRRTGFEIVSLSGEIVILATKSSEIVFKNQMMLGDYKVNLDAMEKIAVPELIRAKEHSKTVIVDEIGPMEILSKTFCNTILDMIEQPSLKIIGTIVQRPYEFADAVKKHPRVQLKLITTENRDLMAQQLEALLNNFAD